MTPLAVPPALGDPSALAEELLHVARAYRHADAFDVIHDHTGTGPLVGAGLGCPVPIVHTLHGPWTADSRRCVDLVQQRVHLVAISRAQRDANPRLDPLTHVVYNGVDLHAHHVADEKADHLVFVGRVSPEKRPELAIAVARRAGMPLVMIVKRTEPAERAYWDAAVAPLLGHDVAVLDQPPHQVKVDLVGRARALLFPIDWPEPFGLVVTEAMACGTPVVARPFGAVPEIVDHGVNGFLATTVAQMARCARQAVHLDPASCRASVAARFSAEAMVSGYEDIYRAALARRAAGRSSTSRRPPHAEPSGGTAA